jgi:ribosome-associated translation inhibitor RaiA
MTLPLQITFRNIKHSAEIEGWIRTEAEKLETFYHRIIGCRVAVEVPHRHHRKAKPLHIRIDLTLPGKEIVITQEPVALRRTLVKREDSSTVHAKPGSLHSDMELAIHEAFKSAGRRLKDFARRQRGKVKNHAVVLVEV